MNSTPTSSLLVPAQPGLRRRAGCMNATSNFFCSRRATGLAVAHTRSPRFKDRTQSNSALNSFMERRNQPATYYVRSARRLPRATDNTFACSGVVSNLSPTAGRRPSASCNASTSRSPIGASRTFLDTIPRSELSAEQRADVCALVEGFDAAIVEDASIIGIAKEWRSGVNDTSHRPVHGYAPVMEHLARIAGDRLLLRTEVTRIGWSAHDITIDAVRDGEPLRVRAKRAIITLPIGVLQAGSRPLCARAPFRKTCGHRSDRDGPGPQSRT